MFALLLKIYSIVYEKECSMSTSQPFLLFCILDRYWPFLEKSGPHKWLVGATLAFKQNFLAGTLELVSMSTSQPFLLFCILDRYWPFLEKSGPQKWLVGATLALKQNFLAGTLELVIISLQCKKTLNKVNI